MNEPEFILTLNDANASTTESQVLDSKVNGQFPQQFDPASEPCIKPEITPNTDGAFHNLKTDIQLPAAELNRDGDK